MSQTDLLGAPDQPAPEHSLAGIAARARPGRLRRTVRATVRSLVGLLALSGIYLGIEQLIGNFHTVVPGQLYRAGQVNADQLAGIQAEYGVRTVINLRGPTRAAWYADELAESKRLGIEHIDYRLVASQELTQKQVEELIAIMRDAPKPILVHCKGGSDRSGLASALYIAAISKGGEEAAEWQLSLLYGHFPFPYFPAWAMDETFERIEPWLGFPDS